jgi:hypothetical protein
LAECKCCGKRFNVNKVREKYNTHFADFGDDTYFDYEYGSDTCFSCAKEDTKENYEAGAEALV